MSLPKFIKLVEVSPRDGLQNEPRLVPTDIKIAFIRKLAQTGLKTIESTSFVSPKWIPQLADNSAVMRAIAENPAPCVSYPVLVPNKTGLQHAIDAGATHIAVFTAATETFCQKNTGCSLAESLERAAEVMRLAKQHAQIKNIRAYISCAVECPYEGKIAPETVAAIAEKLWALGAQEISLGDTIGKATPLQAQQLVDTVATKIPRAHLAAHFHDTYGQALANLFAVIERGIAIIDSAVYGLGGCPYAKGASGNVATEDVLYMLNGLGIATGVDLEALLQAGKFIARYLQQPPRSKIAVAMGILQ